MTRPLARPRLTLAKDVEVMFCFPLAVSVQYRTHKDLQLGDDSSNRDRPGKRCPPPDQKHRFL
jgi:hypothetical protein